MTFHRRADRGETHNHMQETHFVPWKPLSLPQQMLRTLWLRRGVRTCFVYGCRMGNCPPQSDCDIPNGYGHGSTSFSSPSLHLLCLDSVHCAVYRYGISIYKAQKRSRTHHFVTFSLIIWARFSESVKRTPSLTLLKRSTTKQT